MTFPLTAVLLSAVACLVVGRTASSVVDNMRPAQAVTMLSCVSLVVSLASGISLTTMAVAVIARLHSVAAEEHWSAVIIRSEIPVPNWLGTLTACAVIALLIRSAISAGTIVLALVRAERLCRQIRVDGGPVVIVDDDSADAYTVAGLRGCVVISQRLLTAMTADERRVLTAHELSHLTRRHHLHVHLADIAAAANPLLNPVRAAVRLGVERWDDEDAATGIGDRRITGCALARVALLRSALVKGAPSPMTSTRSVNSPVPALGVSNLHVARRVQALLDPAPRSRSARVAAALVLSLMILTVGVASLAHLHEAIEAAAPLLHQAT